jgi:hypothetical protein
MGSPAGRQAELANLANAVGFLSNPFTTMANYVMTGQSPAQFFNVGDWRTAQGVPQGAEPQGIVPPGGVSRLFGGVRDLLFGPPQKSVALGDMRAPANSQAQTSLFNNAFDIASQNEFGPDMARAAGLAAVNLVSQGLDPNTAITLALYSAYNQSLDATQPQMGAPAAQGAPAQFAPQGLSSAVMAQMASGAADMYGKPISADAVAVNPIGGGGQIGVSPDFVGQSLAADNYGVMGFSGGGQSPSEFSFDDASSGAYGYF